MAVLITGGAGYIGAHMAWRLLEEGEDVIVLDRLSTGFAWAVPPEATLVIGDIADTSLVEETIRRHDIDAVFHFAGSVVVPESVANPIAYYANNTVGSLRLIEAAYNCKVPYFIFSSTAAVYGSTKAVLVKEDSPTQPDSPYGSSKLMTEIMLRDAATAHDFTYTVLRYFNVAGADPELRAGQSTKGATHLIKVAAETATGKRSAIEIYGGDYSTPDGTCIRDYIHVADLIEAHVLSLKRLRRGAPSLVANCGYGRGYSVREVISAVERVTGKTIPFKLSPRRLGDLEEIVADATRARRELKWTPQFADLETIVSHAINWELKLDRLNYVPTLK